MNKIICVGLGPGDPELMSLRAYHQLQKATHIAYFRKAGTKGRARHIAEAYLNAVTEYPMEYPVTTEISFQSKDYQNPMGQFYDDWANRLVELSQDHEVTVLCEGDPFFYGSYMHLYERLKGRVHQEVIPAITAMTSAWHATAQPMTWGDDILSVIMGTLPKARLIEAMRSADALAIMKTGKNLPKIAEALEEAGRLDAAYLVQYASMEGEILTKLSEADWENCPYFATVIIHGNGRRP